MMTAFLFSVSLAQTVEVEVHGVEGGGTVGCALFVAGDGFPDDEDKARATTEVSAASARNGVVVCRFTGIAEPRVALAVMHDRDGNGKLNTNWAGLPREPYGFSNNVGLRTFGPPRFEDARFDRVPRIRIDLRD